jgi:class 3 adenylate cyclase
MPMVKFWSDLNEDVGKILREQWTIEDSEGVPNAEDVRLGSNHGKKLDAAILYADLAQSTSLVDEETATFAAEIYKTYLHCAAKIIQYYNGSIVSYDGDRIMAVFVGEDKESEATNCGLLISGAVSTIINPAVGRVYSSKSYEVQHAVGIDTSEVMAARTGVRGDNDLVWVGRAANYAAKLCTFRENYYPIFITSAVYHSLNESAKFSREDKKEDLWTIHLTKLNETYLYKSSWYRYYAD